jgi:hypothetical protein
MAEENKYSTGVLYPESNEELNARLYGYKSKEDKFSEEIHKILGGKTAMEIDWNEIDKLVDKCIENACSVWDGYSGDFWESPMHGAIADDDIEMVKKLLEHGKGQLGDTDDYRWHVEDLGCDWTYKEYIIANMKLDMMKALDIRPTREQMIEARECIFKDPPDRPSATAFMKKVSDKTYEEFMDKVMDSQYNNTVAELNRIVPGSVNKQNINYNKTIKNINNILYPPKNNTRKKILTRNEMLARKAKRALTKNKKGGRYSPRTRKRRV